LYAVFVAFDILNVPPEAKSANILSSPVPRVALVTNGPGWTTTSAPFAIVVLAPVVKVVEPPVNVQFGIGTPATNAWTPEIAPVPVGAKFKANDVPVPPVVVVELCKVIEYLTAVTAAPPEIVTEVPVINVGEPPVSVQFAIPTPPTVTVTPVIVPIPAVDLLIVNVVPVNPVTIVVDERISIIYGMFGGANVNGWLPFEVHEVKRLFVDAYVVVSALSSHTVGNKSAGSNAGLYNWSSGWIGVKEGVGYLAYGCVAGNELRKPHFHAKYPSTSWYSFIFSCRLYETTSFMNPGKRWNPDLDNEK